MYRHILLPTDGSRLSEAASAIGIELARALGARVTALHIVAEVDEPPLEGWARGDARFPEKLGRALERRGRMYLDTVREAAMRAGVCCDCVIAAAASPSGGIVREASARGCDLIVMASHGRASPGGAAASETLQVVALANVPVLAHHPVPAAASAARSIPERRAS